ncbi:MarR family transcriptional regulator [Actinoplanes sp. NPDC051633]|uniref:MarR family winged helix-turn-helix transcriptional regulator n=1 Tax=Actinoplanes sp. NPDC051633 TaxID=3155670 RepID=UPI003448176A
MTRTSWQLAAVEDEVTDALLALSRVFIGLAARSIAQVDEEVTLPQFRTLVLLVSQGPQRVVDLAGELSVTSSTATRMCNRLVSKGLAARQVRPDDRRAAWITLTAPGRDLVGAVMSRRREAIADLVAGLTLIRPLAFAATLNALVEAAGDVPAAQWARLWDGSVAEPSLPSQK